MSRGSSNNDVRVTGISWACLANGCTPPIWDAHPGCLCGLESTRGSLLLCIRPSGFGDQRLVALSPRLSSTRPFPYASPRVPSWDPDLTFLAFLSFPRSGPSSAGRRGSRVCGGLAMKRLTLHQTRSESLRFSPERRIKVRACQGGLVVAGRGLGIEDKTTWGGR